MDSNGSAYTYLFGPRFSYRRHERFTPFVQSAVRRSTRESGDDFRMRRKLKLHASWRRECFCDDVRHRSRHQVSHHIALRLFEGDFLLTHFTDPLPPAGQTGMAEQRAILHGNRISLRRESRPGAERTHDRYLLGRHGLSLCGIRECCCRARRGQQSSTIPFELFWSAQEGAIDGTGPECAGIPRTGRQARTRSKYASPTAEAAQPVAQ